MFDLTKLSSRGCLVEDGVLRRRPECCSVAVSRRRGVRLGCFLFTLLFHFGRKVFVVFCLQVAAGRVCC